MFASNMSETTTSEVYISDFEPDVVKEMVRYLYTDNCYLEVLPEHGDAILAIAHKYSITGLITLCENYLCSTLTVCNVARVLRSADMCNAPRLRAKSLLFIAQNAKTAVQTPQFFDQLGFALCQEVIKLLAGIETK
jgi:hypothetical protein